MMMPSAFGYGMNPMAAFMQQQASLIAPFGANPFMMMPAAAAPPKDPTTAMAALGLYQAQIQAAMAASEMPILR